MPPKRTRRTSPVQTTLSAGERLKRAKLAGNDFSAWGWVGTEVTDVSAISSEHRLAACGFRKNNIHPLCPNEYSRKAKSVPSAEKTQGELDDDVIVISDDESSPCSVKQCKANPYCINYLGQDKWETEEKAQDAFLKLAKLEDNPYHNSRDAETPIGLKNLGATCYANAFLQVWYQDLPFRSGVYQCLPSPDEQTKFEESPIFQLQVTFAAMQESSQSAFNPVKLVESLKLRTTEQQDAQEFSKLFMAHLDSEFQQQSVPGLKSLLADQFQGKQAYGTICSNCQTRSERENEFLEIEVNIQNNATLEDRITALLEPEELSGDNQYLCSVCESLQDAKRYTEFRQLPPVLHVSLLRFVFDLSSMERKKSKHTIAFPMTLDMGRFVGSARQVNGVTKGDYMYQLRGVLLHKGQSAYHGHYEAQVFDVKNQAWYQFNDETVTSIVSLGPRLKSSDTDKTNGTIPTTKTTGDTTVRPKKRARLQDSDVDITSGESTPKSEEYGATNNHITSKDAYMLIYARVPNGTSSSTSSQMDVDSPVARIAPCSDTITPINLTPPMRALEVVRSLNEEYDKNCAEFTKRERETKSQFQQKRRIVMDIYRNWEVTSPTTESVVVSKQALESWLSRYIQKPSERKESTDNRTTPPKDSLNPSTNGFDSSPGEGKAQSFSNLEITCIHGRLDPNKSSNMKRITKRAAECILLEDNARFDPMFEPEDVCELCVENSFNERLYQIHHPQVVARFEEVCFVGEGEQGYWISKPWLRDWKLAKPKMHEPSHPDPSPSSEDYQGHVECEHGGLTTNPSTRRRISLQGYDILREIFPDWQTLSTETEPCAVCEAAMHIAREDKRGIKKQAEDEKAKLKHTFDNALLGTTQLLQHVPCAVVPVQFLRSWKQWLFRPTEVSRPERVNTSQFICKHGLLTLDPDNPADLSGVASFIKRTDWHVLETLYSCGPLIAIENSGVEWEHDLALCHDCRSERLVSFEHTELTIRILQPNDPIPTTETYSADPRNDEPRKFQPLTYGSTKVGGTRQSKRIRYGKTLGRRRKILINRHMTVKELKAKIQEDLRIPTIYQRLFYRGSELEDNTLTIRTLGITTNDLIDLREESEDVELLSSGTDEQLEEGGAGGIGGGGEKSRARKAKKKKKMDEGGGFVGTLLSGAGSTQGSVINPTTTNEMPSIQDEPNGVDMSSQMDSKGVGGGGGSSRTTTPESSTRVISCPACTFDNPAHVLSCEMCDTLLLLESNA